MIRPHVQAEIDATRAAMAQLRLAAGRAAPPRRKPAASAKHAAAGKAMLALDDAYTAGTGTILTLDNAPKKQLFWFGSYRAICKTGPGVRWTVIMALYRLRDGAGGCRPNTLEAALVYFDAIWPDDLAWPSDIPRPSTKKEDAA